MEAELLDWEAFRNEHLQAMEQMDPLPLRDTFGQAGKGPCFHQVLCEKGPQEEGGSPLALFHRSCSACSSCPAGAWTGPGLALGWSDLACILVHFIVA